MKQNLLAVGFNPQGLSDNAFPTDFRRFMAKRCILLLFRDSASKFQQLLITANAINTYQFQREFDSNVAIATQEFSSASKPPRQKTNFSKLSLLLRSSDSLRLCLRLLSFAELLTSCNAEMLVTNRIQREFLFNDAIQSHGTLPASKPPRQKTNLFKLMSFVSFVSSW